MTLPLLVTASCRMNFIRKFFHSNASSFRMVQFNFRGQIAPVFTPFNNDENKTLNLKVIPEYAKYLLGKGVKGLLVNGTTGEGMSLNVHERKQTTEKWAEICKETKQTLMIQVGGVPLPDVLELARHAEELKVDALLCLPELYFKPKNSEELIEYLKVVSDAAPNTPLLYYHIPAFTNVNINMAEFLKKASTKINTLAGIKFTSPNLVEGAECIHVSDGKFVIFLGVNQIMSAAYTLGFDSAIATTLNMFPEYGQTIFEAIKNKQDVELAQKSQKNLTVCINLITKNGGWVLPAMKAAMNLFTPINVGPVRKPLEELTKNQKDEMQSDILGYLKAIE